MPRSLHTTLTADIGGTNTRLALFDGSDLRAGSLERFSNKGDVHLYDHLERYLDQIGQTPDTVSLALAGPVNGTAGRMTNLNWDITSAEATRVCGGARTVLLNDLQAQGHALPYLPPSAIKRVFGQAEPFPDAPKLVIGLGTGVNIAVVHKLPDGTLFVPPAEAGHTTFAPHLPDLQAYAAAIHDKLGHAAMDDVLSGRGIENAYNFASGQDLAAEEVIARRAQDESDATLAVGLLTRMLAEFASDMALVQLARGGVYLVGGVARALTPYLSGPEFAGVFTDKGRFSDFTRSVPVFSVHDDYAALAGACRYAIQARAQ